jgi:hypothetical protein
LGFAVAHLRYRAAQAATSGGVLDAFAGRDAHRIFERGNEDGADVIVVFARGGPADDGNGLVRPTILDDDLELDPGDEIDGVFLSPGRSRCAVRVDRIPAPRSR